MNIQLQKLQIITVFRMLLMVTGLVLFVVFGHVAVLQATSWQAVAGQPL